MMRNNKWCVITHPTNFLLLLAITGCITTQAKVVRINDDRATKVGNLTILTRYYDVDSSPLIESLWRSDLLYAISIAFQVQPGNSYTFNHEDIKGIGLGGRGIHEEYEMVKKGIKKNPYDDEKTASLSMEHVQALINDKAKGTEIDRNRWMEQISNIALKFPVEVKDYTSGVLFFPYWVHTIEINVKGEIVSTKILPSHDLYLSPTVDPYKGMSKEERYYWEYGGYQYKFYPKDW